MPGAFGFVGANGGYLSKYSTGVYSTTPVAWRGFDSRDLQAEIDAWPAPTLAPDSASEGAVETYTVDYAGDAPRGIVVCRTPEGARFVAMTEASDAVTVQRMIAEEPLGAAVVCRRDSEGRRVIATFIPAAQPARVEVQA